MDFSPARQDTTTATTATTPPTQRDRRRAQQARPMTAARRLILQARRDFLLPQPEPRLPPKRCLAASLARRGMEGDGAAMGLVAASS